VRRVLLSTIITLLLIASGLSAAEPLDLSRYVALSEVRAGMKGIGKTVFSGTKVEEFPLEVVGVLRKQAPGIDIILIRSDAERLAKTGLSAGMSGSPVYIEGRLLGAISYAWKFAEGAYAGVTPIEEMIEAARQRVQAPEGAGSIAAREDLAERIFRALLPEEVLSPAGRSQPLKAGPVGGMLEPFPVPLLGTGISQGALENLASRFQQFGFITAGSPELKKETEKVVLEPGSVVFAKLVEGDVDISVMGTITEIADGKVLAFGHTLLGGIALEQPMALGEVHMILPNRLMSVKLGQPTETVGAFVKDTAAGMLGRLDRKAKMIDVELVIGEASGPPAKDWGSTSMPQATETKRYRFRVIDHPQYSASLIGTVMLSAFVARGFLPTENSLRMDIEIEVEGVQPLKITDCFTGQTSATQAVAALSEPLRLLMENELARAKIEKVKIYLNQWKEARYAYIESVKIDKEEVEQGDKLNVEVTLIPYRRPKETVSFEVQIPPQAAPGRRALSVSDYASNLRLDMAEARYRYEPENIEQLMEIITQKRDRTCLYVRVSAERFGLSVGSKELPNLPPSLIAILSTVPQTKVGPIFFPWKMEVPTPYILEGQHYLFFTFKKKEK